MMKNPQRALLTALLLLALSPGLFSQEEEPRREEVFAPFVSRFKAEAKGASILISWKDARNLDAPSYKIYASERPFDKETLETAALIGETGPGVQQFLYEPGDGRERYYLVLAEDGERLYDVFIPYRNMSLAPAGAVLAVVEEGKASLLSELIVIPHLQEIQVNGRSSRPERPVLLFRSTVYPAGRKELSQAARVTILQGERLQWNDPVVPGIPFYYALVDKALYEAGSEAILYEGSVTQEPVLITLEEWAPQGAHAFHFFSRHTPLPMLNINKDIEWGGPLPGPALGEGPVELSGETALGLARLNFGKSVRAIDWREVEILAVDTLAPLHPAVRGLPLSLENQNWAEALAQADQALETYFEEEIQARLHYYRGQARYFRGEYEYAFMDFLASRDRYYSESNRWLYNIIKLQQLQTKKENVAF